MTRLGGVLEQAPRIGAVTPTLGGELVHGCHERRRLPGIDAIFNRHHDGAALERDIARHDRRRPVHRRREIEFRTPACSFKRHVSATPGQRTRG